VKNNSILFLFLIANVIVTFAWAFNGDLAWVPFLQGLNFPDYAFGYLWSAMGAVGIFASLMSIKFMKKGKERQFILSTIILTIIFLLSIIFVNNLIPAFLIFLFLTFFVKMSYPAERVYFHKFIKSKLRATIGSVESMLISIIGIISIPLAGLSVDYLGARYTILLSALLLVPSIIIYLKIRNKENLAE
jgi:predicted MFS family arabinose efflux permease